MINLHERMLPTSAGVEPATSWSPVGRRVQLSHWGRLSILYMIVNLMLPNQAPDSCVNPSWRPLALKGIPVKCIPIICQLCASDNLHHAMFVYCYDRALLPSIICLGRLRIVSKYIFNLWQLRQRVDSLAQWLEHWIFNREDRVRFQRQAWDVFQQCIIPI